MTDRPGFIDSPGFADPVHDSQACFRAVLDAMSRPGRVYTVATGVDAPAPLDPATASVLLTLLDAETPLFLDPALHPARDWIAFHCGAPFAQPGHAAFGAGLSLPDLSPFPAGTDDDPEDGATLVLQLPSLHDGPALRLTGPGVDGSAILRPAGLPADFAARWAANHALFPRGADLILCAGTALAALPRSVRVDAI